MTGSTENRDATSPVQRRSPCSQPHARIKSRNRTDTSDRSSIGAAMVPSGQRLSRVDIIVDHWPEGGRQSGPSNRIVMVRDWRVSKGLEIRNYCFRRDATANDMAAKGQGTAVGVFLG